MDTSASNIELWKRIILTPESSLMKIYQEAIKKIPYPKKTIMINVLNHERSQKLRTEVRDIYKVEVDWDETDNNICSTEIYKKVE